MTLIVNFVFGKSNCQAILQKNLFVYRQIFFSRAAEKQKTCFGVLFTNSFNISPLTYFVRIFTKYVTEFISISIRAAQQRNILLISVSRWTYYNRLLCAVHINVNFIILKLSSFLQV